MKTTTIMVLINLLIMSVVGITASNVNLKLPAIFSDNMVLQQGVKIPIWGWAEPETKILVVFANLRWTMIILTDKTGKWRVKLPPFMAGGPYEMTITAHNKDYRKNEVITFKNVMVGEVWVCSGQSNMEMPVGGAWGKVNNYEPEIVAAKYPNIRLFTVPRNVAFSLQNDVNS
ncbi:MAG: sialate O-acetylesterase, partial [bacterium]|nr:sialate O-acetylesterase [bacterium]